MRKILGALLSLMLMAALFCVPSFAADPVTPEQDVVRVTLPTAITVTDNRDGTFVTSDTTITNNGKADVKVSGITVEPSSGWTLVDWDSLADYTATGEQFISALFYGAAVDASGAAAGESLPAIASGESTALDCDFWLSPQVDPLNQQVAVTVVTIAFDGNGGLAGITVDTPPDTVDYLPGDAFDPTGMEVTAHYYDGSTADVTNYVAVEDGTDLVLGQDTVTVTYTEDDITVEAAVDITVSDPAVTVILYEDGELVFQDSDAPEPGRAVKATYSGIETLAATSYSDIPWIDEVNNITEVTFAADVKPISTAYWFFRCTNLVSINGLSEHLNTSDTTDMSYMFGACSALSELSLSGLDTSSVTSMYNMFSGCSGLTSLDVADLDVSRVTNMSNLFYGNTSLTTLDLSDWNTGSVTSMYRMFYNCNALENVSVSGFDTSSVTSMNGMFGECWALSSLDVSGWDVNNVVDMYGLFTGCESLTELDLSGWDTSSVYSMDEMFFYCPSLKTIYASDSFVTTHVPDSDRPFYQNTALVGGNGTAFVSPNFGKDYACIDRPGQPGYFTSAFAVPISVTIRDCTSTGRYTEPAGGWMSGVNEFVVNVEDPCVVILVRNGVATELSCVTSGTDTHTFTVYAQDGDEIVLAYRGDANLDGNIDYADATCINGLVRGTYAPDSDIQLIAMDMDRDGDADSDDATAVNESIFGLFAPEWNDGERPFKVTFYNYVSGSDSYKEEDWHEGENVLMLDKPYTVTLTRGNSTVFLSYEQDGVDTITPYHYTIDAQYGDIVEVYESDGQSIRVTVIDYTGGRAPYVEPSLWQEGANDFIVSGNQACVVALVRNGVTTELQCVALPDGTHLFTVDAEDGDRLLLAYRGDVNLNGVVDTSDSTCVNQYNLGLRDLDDFEVMIADVDLDGGIDFADPTTINQAALGMYTIRWNLLDGLNTILLSEPIEVNILDETEGAAVVTAPEEGWVTGENTFTVTCAEPVAVYLVPADGEAVELMGETLDETTTLYTVELAEGDSIRVTLAEAEPAPLPIEVTILDETEGAAVVTAPEAGWVAGENTFTVTSAAPVAVYHVPVDGEPVELTGETLDDTTTRYTVTLAEGDSIRMELAETEPVPETIEVNVLDETGGAAVLTGPEEGWVTCENTFMVSSTEAVSVYHVAADTTVTELTGEAVDDTTTRYTVTLAEGDSIRMELAATEPELPEEQLPAEETPVEEVPGDPENQTPETSTEPSDPVPGAPAEEEPPVEEVPPVEEALPVEEPEAEDTDTVPEPEAPVEEPETDGTETVTEPEAPETSDESAPDTSDEAGEGLQTGEPSPAGEENTVEDVQAGGAETEPAMLPDDETDEAGALAA